MHPNSRAKLADPKRTLSPWGPLHPTRVQIQDEAVCFSFWANLPGKYHESPPLQINSTAEWVLWPQFGNQFMRMKTLNSNQPYFAQKLILYFIFPKAKVLGKYLQRDAISRLELQNIPGEFDSCWISHTFGQIFVSRLELQNIPGEFDPC